MDHVGLAGGAVDRLPGVVARGAGAAWGALPQERVAVQGDRPGAGVAGQRGADLRDAPQLGAREVLGTRRDRQDRRLAVVAGADVGEFLVGQRAVVEPGLVEVQPRWQRAALAAAPHVEATLRERVVLDAVDDAVADRAAVHPERYLAVADPAL